MRNTDSNCKPHLLIFIQHLPGLVQQISIEAGHQDTILSQLILDLLIPDHTYTIVQVIEEHGLSTCLLDDVLQALYRLSGSAQNQPGAQLLQTLTQTQNAVFAPPTSLPSRLKLALQRTAERCTSRQCLVKMLSRHLQRTSSSGDHMYNGITFFALFNAATKAGLS